MAARVEVTLLSGQFPPPLSFLLLNHYKLLIILLFLLCDLARLVVQVATGACRLDFFLGCSLRRLLLVLMYARLHNTTALLVVR